MGVELYGGLGTHADFDWHETLHYIAPTVAWTLMNGTTFRGSPSFGLTERARISCCASVRPMRWLSLAGRLATCFTVSEVVREIASHVGYQVLYLFLVNHLFSKL